MAKFIILYNGPATDMEDMSEEQSRSIMEAWQKWMDRVGESLVDVGSPMANGESVADDGSDGPVSQLSGYSIIQAEDMGGAKALVEGHPFLSEGEGNFAVEIHELLPVPM